MKLVTDCNDCTEEIKIKSYASTRPELEMDKGEKFEVRCNHCRKRQEKHVNDIKAKPNQVIIIGGILIGLIVTILLWKVLGAVGTISGLIPVFLWKQQSNAVHLFNVYRGRRT